MSSFFLKFCQSFDYLVTELSSLSVIILVIDKSETRLAVVQFYQPLIWLQTELDSTRSYYHY